MTYQKDSIAERKAGGYPRLAPPPPPIIERRDLDIRTKLVILLAGRKP